VRGGAQRRGWAWRLFLAVLAVATTGAVHAHIDTAARISQGESFVPRPESARLLALGFDAVVADYYWLLAVQLVGGAVRQDEMHTPQIARLIDVATTVDPWVDHPYRFAALWLTDSEKSVHEANRLLRRGIAYHPTDWRNRYHLGFNHFFYLGDNQRALEALQTAIPLEGSPNYLGGLVARMRSEQGGIGTAADFLAELARTAQDEYERAAYEKALDEIQVERAARYLEAARDEYLKRFGRDISRVEDLMARPSPVLRALPQAHPHLRGFEWVLDPESGEIVSSFYGSRYRLHEHPSDVARRERWKALREARSGSEG
jgi:hypothetical protein